MRRLTDPRIALSAACVVLFAAIGVFVTENRPIDIAGTVIDSRTDKPVKGARLDAVGVHEKTNAKGAFSVFDIKRGANVRVSADNYKPVDVQATSDPIRVVLRPIPVTGRIISSFTGKGIGASVRGKDLTKTRADGVFKIYGIGPGDTLTITAFGHQPKKVKVSPKRTASTSLALARIQPASLLRAVKGYTYVDAPGEFSSLMRAEIATSTAIQSDKITGVAAKSVVKDGKPFAIAFAVTFDPAYAALPGSQKAFFEGFTADAKTKRTITIGDYRVREGTHKDFAGYAFQRFAGFVVVMGEPKADVEKFVRTMLLGDNVAA